MIIIRTIWFRAQLLHNWNANWSRQNSNVDLNISRLTAKFSFENPLRDARLKLRTTTSIHVEALDFNEFFNRL